MDNKIDRRKALRIMGLSVAAATVASFKNNSFAQSLSQKIENDEITPVIKRENPKNGDMVSLIGFGCMRFPTNGKGRNAPVDRAKVQELVDYAYAHGINYYDTAYVYHGGKSEEIIGEALKKYPRESFFLADKMPGYMVRTKEDIANFFEEQLNRCQTDYFDYYLLHNIDNRATYDKVYEEFGGYNYLVEQQKKGRIKRLGFSFHGDRKLWDYVIDLHPWEFVQIQLNYIDWKIDGEYLYNSLQERKIPCIIMEPLLGGRLASLSQSANRILKEKRPDDSIASWAFRYVGSLPNVLTALSGMTYMEHLQDNIKTFSDFRKLGLSEKMTLNKAIVEYEKFKRIGCTACRYCMPCPFEVEIPTVFETYNSLVMSENIPSRDDQSEDVFKEKSTIFANTFKEKFANGGGATMCVGCGACEPKCPQHLAIPDIMDMIKANLE